MNNISKIKANVNKSHGLEFAVLFFIWPLFSFFLALQNFGNKQSRKIIIAFFSFFGFTMNFGREGLDGYTHAQHFMKSVDLTLADFFNSILNYISRKPGSSDLDIYTTVINFLVSRITDSYHIVFLVHALIFSYFSVKVFAILFDEFNGKLNKNSFIFFVFLFFIFPVSIVHGIRFPIASWIYIYGAYQLLRTENRKYLLYCLSATFVHFSFILGFALILAYYLLGNRNYIYVSILILSFIVPGLFYGYLTSFNVAQIGDGLSDKVEAYSRESYIKDRNESLQTRNWYVRIRIPLLQYVTMGILFIIGYLKKSNYYQDKTQKNLMSFIILLLAFINFGSSFDSLGRRFLIIWLVFAIIYVYRFFQINKFQHYSIYTILYIFPIVLWIFVQTRAALDVMTYMWLIGNPITAFFVEMEAIIK